MTRYYYYLEDGLYKKYKVEDTKREEFDKFRRKIITSCSEYEDVSKLFSNICYANLERERSYSKSIEENSEIINWRERFQNRGILGKKLAYVEYTICRKPNLIRLIDGVNGNTYYGDEYFHTILTEDFTHEISTVKDKLLQESRLVEELMTKDCDYLVRKELVTLRKLQNLYERNATQEDPRIYYKEALALFPYEIVDELTEEDYQRYQKFFDEPAKRRIRER